jgi:hypothetical protein
MNIEVALILPHGWRAKPSKLSIEAPPKARISRRFRLYAGRHETKPTPRLAIAADVIADGKHLGQIAEAVVNVA